MSLVPEDNDPEDNLNLEIPEETNLTIDPLVVKVPVQKKNYEIRKPLVNDTTDEVVDKFDVLIPALADTGSRTDKDIEGSNSNSQVDVSKDSIGWYTTLMSGFAAHPSKGVFEDALANPNANWRNSLSINDQPIGIGRPRFNNKGRGSQMSSERLTMSIRAKLGMGSPVQVPLMASGFYVTVKPMEEIAILNMWRDIVAETVRLGRQTHGLIFSNNQVFTARAIYKAWESEIMNTTVNDLPLTNLIDHITINDLPLIAQSMASAIYPNGFPLIRAVFNENTSLPKGEVKQIIDIGKSLFMDDSAFTEEQKLHMVKRIDQPMTLKQVKEYKEGFTFNQTNIVDIGDGIKLHLHTPTLREYFDSGEKWINEILQAVTDALGEDANDNARVPHISNLAKATRLRQYSHYIKAVEEEEILYSTRDNVDKVLSSLSSNDDVSKKVYEAVSNYINHTQVAIIATTSINEYEDTISGEKFPRLIPIDAISVFFQLAAQKSHGIASRALEAT